MDKYVAVPVELSAEMLEAWERRGIERVKLAMAGVESITPYRTSIKETYAVALAAAPTTHVAVKRELLEEISTECAKCYKIMGGNIEHAPTQYGYGLIWSKLRALLSTEG